MITRAIIGLHHKIILLGLLMLPISFTLAQSNVKVKCSFTNCLIDGVSFNTDHINLVIKNHQKKQVILLDHDTIKIRATFCGHGQYTSLPQKRIKECWVTIETFVDGKWFKQKKHPGAHAKQRNPFNRTCWGKLYRTNNQNDPFDLRCGYRHSIPRKINPLDISMDFECIFDI
jgi:hypothetical protein